ncbi:MAG: hypothetical protein Q8N42_00450, partial [bacterium]|nr:hypothetical protein [bacterium]
FYVKNRQIISGYIIPRMIKKVKYSPCWTSSPVLSLSKENSGLDDNKKRIGKNFTVLEKQKPPRYRDGLIRNLSFTKDLKEIGVPCERPLSIELLLSNFGSRGRNLFQGKEVWNDTLSISCYLSSMPFL